MTGCTGYKRYLYAFCLSTDSVLSSKVQQSPSDLIKSRGDSMELHCLHNISSYNVILWYKSRVDQELTLLGNLFMTNDNYDEGKLQIKALTSNDSAVYFCAFNDLDG
uniref:Ig-like domain-containing protein n=1 Tax=Astyanax mexicanus TaxID=7994 RepID=A0A8B9L6P9_ASTMX